MLDDEIQRQSRYCDRSACIKDDITLVDGNEIDDLNLRYMVHTLHGTYDRRLASAHMSYVGCKGINMEHYECTK